MPGLVLYGRRLLAQQLLGTVLDIKWTTLVKAEKGGGKGVEEIYNNNPDLRLLLDLLADSSGVPTAISILTLLDQVSLSLVGSPRDTLLSLVHHVPLCHKDTQKGTFCIWS